MQLEWAGRASSGGPSSLSLAATATAGLALCGISFAVALSGSPDADGWIAAGRGLMVVVPVAVGLYAWRRQPTTRFGPLLVATGFAWFLTTLAESGNEVLYSVGRLAGWLVEAALVYLVLAFPSGRLYERVDRVLALAAGLGVATLFLPTALLVERYPVPSPHGSCEASCPDNAFLVLGSEPGFVDGVIRPLREVIAVLLFLAVTARLTQRVRRATPLMRRTLSPVLFVASARLVLLAIVLLVRRAAPEPPVVDDLAWAAALALPVMAVGFFVGLVRWRLFVADALQQLALRLKASLPPDELRDALAAALGDPSLRLAYWAGTNGGHWIDAGGRALELPPPEPGLRVTEVRDDGRRIAAVIHDAALSDQKELVQAAASYARMTLENQRLAVRLESSLREVSSSRARIAAAADEERRRIERDLHDGVQQRLVALRIKLELAEGLVRADPERGLQSLRAIGDEVELTLEEIRALARGVYSPLLADRGLVEALLAASRRAPVPAIVACDEIGRYAQELEAAVYFCCLEALQNASKHARGASRVTVSLAEDDSLRFQVLDDGAGFDLDAVAPGAGLMNMRDRIEAMGGELSIESAPGRGTAVAGSVPLAS